MDDLTVDVRMHNGSPTLFINGIPDTGLMLYHNNVALGHDEIADFARAGINLVTAPMGGVEALRPDGSLSFGHIDKGMRIILEANPKALVLIRLSLAPPKWWRDANPDHMMVHRDPYLDGTVEAEWPSASFASDKWREEMGAVMQAIIGHCEERFGGSILGYHLCAGDCGEWSYAWRHFTQSDYSSAQLAAFRKWMGDDAAVIPGDWRKPPGAGPWMDPEADEMLIRYKEFHSAVVADAILHFARLAKERLGSLGRRKVVAVFYGYHFTPPGNPSSFFNSGHHALAKVLASPDIDIVCAPYSYYGREAGGTYYSQLVTGSVRLHGKLAYSEEDTVTHVVPPIEYRYHCPDPWTTVNVLRRNVLAALRDGGTAWYMDWFGMNWYRDPIIMDSIAETVGLAKERLERDNESVAGIAVTVSESMASLLWHDPDAINAWTLERMMDLWRIGAPIDVFLDTDEGLLGDRYPLVIRLDREDTRTPGEWREAAKVAGVHLYCESGDQVLAEKGLLTVHACSNGARTIRLPDMRRVVEAFTGETVSDGADAFTVEMRTGETRVWKLAPMGAREAGTA